MSLIEASFRRAFTTIKHNPIVAGILFIITTIATGIYDPAYMEAVDFENPVILSGAVALGVVFFITSIWTFIALQLATKKSESLATLNQHAFRMSPQFVWKCVQVMLLGVALVLVPFMLGAINPVLIPLAFLLGMPLLVVFTLASIFGGFMPYIFVEKPELNIWESFKLSARMVRDNFMQLFLLVLIWMGVGFVLFLMIIIASGVYFYITEAPELASEADMGNEVAFEAEPMPLTVNIPFSILSGVITTLQYAVTASVFYIITEGSEQESK